MPQDMTTIRTDGTMQDTGAKGKGKGPSVDERTIYLSLGPEYAMVNLSMYDKTRKQYEAAAAELSDVLFRSERAFRAISTMCRADRSEDMSAIEGVADLCSRALGAVYERHDRALYDLIGTLRDARPEASGSDTTQKK